MTFKFKNIPQYTGFGNYKVDVSWAYLEEHIQTQIDCEDGFDLDPDFQRAHVWTEDKQHDSENS